MFTATLDANNQITLPLEIRKQLRIRPGDKVQFVPSETGEVLLRNGSARALQRAQAAFAGAAEAMGLKSEEDVRPWWTRSATAHPADPPSGTLPAWK